MKHKSIITSDMEHCYVCGTPLNLHIHHCIYGNGKRKLADKYKLIIPLCARHHNMSNEGVHFNKILDNEIKQLAQKKFNETYPDLDFLKTFGKSYL